MGCLLGGIVRLSVLEHTSAAQHWLLCGCGTEQSSTNAPVPAGEVHDTLVAESLVLRGARQGGARVSPAQASEALDSSLRAAGTPLQRQQLLLLLLRWAAEVD